MGHHLDTSTIQRPRYHYRARTPVFTTDPETGDIDSTPCTLTTNTRETVLWCEGCSDEGVWTQLTRVLHKPYVFSVWHKDDGPNIATGELIGDRRQLARAFKKGEDRQEEVVGYRPDYREASPRELLDSSRDDSGLQSQHDRAVAEQRKDSRGKFVF